MNDLIYNKNALKVSFADDELEDNGLEIRVDDCDVIFKNFQNLLNAIEDDKGFYFYDTCLITKMDNVFIISMGIIIEDDEERYGTIDIEYYGFNVFHDYDYYFD